MLWHLALAHSQSSGQTQTFYKKLLRVKNLFMMDALELTHWALSLEELTPSSIKLKTLLFSGFACKQFYCTDLKSIEAKCEVLIPSFSEKFRRWTLVTETAFPLPHAQLNHKFKELTASTVVKKSPLRLHATNARKYSEISYKSDVSTEEDIEWRMETDMMHFEMDTMKGEKLSPIDSLL
jgi:hypothetical protein